MKYHLLSALVAAQGTNLFEVSDTPVVGRDLFLSEKISRSFQETFFGHYTHVTNENDQSLFKKSVNKIEGMGNNIEHSLENLYGPDGWLGHHLSSTTYQFVEHAEEIIANRVAKMVLPAGTGWIYTAVSATRKEINSFTS